MADLITVKIRDLIETQSVATTDYMVVEKTNGTYKCEARFLKGASGVTPNISIGNTNTLPPGQLATVSRRGSNEAPVFDFGIPQGIQGPIGLTGPKGDTPDITPLKNEIDNRFNVLTSEQQGDSEVIDARGNYTSLKARLDSINDDLIKYNDQTIVTHTTENDFSSIDATKNGYLDNILLEGKTLVVDSNNQVVLPGTQGATLKSVGDGVDKIIVSSLNKNLLNKNNLESISTTVVPKIVNNGFEVDYSNVISIPYYKINIVNDSYLNLDVIKKGSADILVRGYLNLEDMKASRNFVFSKGLTLVGKAQEIIIPSNTKYIAFQRGSALTGLVGIDNISITTTSNNLFVEHKENTKNILYKDTDGLWKKPTLRQWDSIEKHSDGKYYYHKRSEGMLINGSESNYLTRNQPSNTSLFRIGLNINGLFKKDGDVICNLFNNEKQSYDVEGISIHGVDGNLDIVINKSKASNLTEFKRYAQNNNILLVSQLTNEQVFECTPIDLISYDTQTNYSVECGPIYPKTTLKVNSYLGNVVSILKDKVSYLENMLVDGLKMVVAGNMQELAYRLYPQDFVSNVDDSASMEVIE